MPKPTVTVASAWVSKDEYGKAIADFDEAIRLKPDYALAYRNRGTTLVLNGKYEFASSDYEEAIRLNPNHAEEPKNQPATL